MVTGARMQAASNTMQNILSTLSVAKSYPTRFTLINSHSMAVSSQRDGELEMMMHRSLGQDDGRGLAEQVADSTRIDVPIWISLDAVR